MNRRSFLRGLFAAPAIVVAENLMPLRGVLLPPPILQVAELPVGLTLSLDEFSERILRPAMEHLRDAIEHNIMFGKLDFVSELSHG